MPYYENFELLLSKKHLLPGQVAKATNISPVVFSDWKSGKSKPKIDKLVHLAKFFNVSIDYFIIPIQELQDII